MLILALCPHLQTSCRGFFFAKVHFSTLSNKLKEAFHHAHVISRDTIKCLLTKKIFNLIAIKKIVEAISACKLSRILLHVVSFQRWCASNKYYERGCPCARKYSSYKNHFRISEKVYYCRVLLLPEYVNIILVVFTCAQMYSIVHPVVLSRVSGFS